MLKEDRTYYRLLPVSELIEAGRDSDSEIAIALAERLEDAVSKWDAMLNELNRGVFV